MRRNLWITCAVLLAAVAGCAPTAQEDYDQAVADLKRAEQRLDNLRPAYDEARKDASLQVCKEFAGATPDESAAAALQQLSAAVNEPAAAPEAPVSGKKPVGDADAALDQLMAAQKDFSQKQATATAPLLKTQEVMRNIKVVGTPENKRFEEVLAEMPAAKTYQRQEKRVADAKQAVKEAEADLPDDGDKAK
jgi:hypothetical protein